MGGTAEAWERGPNSGLWTAEVTGCCGPAGNAVAAAGPVPLVGGLAPNMDAYDAKEEVLEL